MNFTLTPDQPAERMEVFTEYFGEKLQTLHNACCFYILEMCLQWTRVDTGRLVSGWIPFMQAHSEIADYSRSLRSPRDEKSGAEEEGISQGVFTEAYLNLYVENGVNYAGFVDNALSGPNGGIFDMTGDHSFKPAPVATFQAATPLFTEAYGTRMEALLKNCDSWLDKIMAGSNGDDIEIQTDLGPPEMN